MTYKINVTDACIGCEACVNICDNFKMVNGKSVPVQDTVEEIECNDEAKGVCPVAAIEIEEM